MANIDRATYISGELKEVTAILFDTLQGSPQAYIKAERVGVVWAEFLTTLIDFLPTSKLN